MELTPFRIARWHERYEFTTELMLSSSAVSLGTTSKTCGLPGLGFPRLRAADMQAFCERLAAAAFLVPD